MKDFEAFSILFPLARDLEEASKARIASMITMKNKVISYGFNSMKSHPFQRNYSKMSEAIYLHSEIDAIKNALKKISTRDFKRCTLWICRVKKDRPHGIFIQGLAKPCDGCMKAIATFGINSIRFTNDGEGFSCL